MFSRSRGNLSDMKTRSLIWFTHLFKHQMAKINMNPAGEEDFCKAVFAQPEMFLKKLKGEKVLHIQVIITITIR